jgi:hypothetical protein
LCIFVPTLAPPVLFAAAAAGDSAIVNLELDVDRSQLRNLIVCVCCPVKTGGRKVDLAVAGLASVQDLLHSREGAVKQQQQQQQ